MEGRSRDERRGGSNVRCIELMGDDLAAKPLGLAHDIESALLLWAISNDHVRAALGDSDHGVTAQATAAARDEREFGAERRHCSFLSQSHQTAMPPSTLMSTPVTNELSSEARKRATLATSSGFSEAAEQSLAQHVVGQFLVVELVARLRGFDDAG